MSMSPSFSVSQIMKSDQKDHVNENEEREKEHPSFLSSLSPKETQANPKAEMEIKYCIPDCKHNNLDV